MWNAKTATQSRPPFEDPERFEAVFDRYHSSIWSFLARLGGPERADELAGDVFLQAFRVRARYDPTLGTVRSWLYGIASNIMHTRKRSDARGMRARARLGTQPEPLEYPIDDVEDAIAYGRDLAVVARALNHLPLADREVIVLYACDELSYAEIASALGIEVGTVRSRLSRARGRLRELLTASGEVLGEGNEGSP